MTPTLGAVLIGLGLLAWEIAKWYPGIKALRANAVGHLGDLLPFLLCWAIGALTVMVVGGIVGWIGDTALWGLNVFGDGLLVFGVGAQTGTAPAPRPLPSPRAACSSPASSSSFSSPVADRAPPPPSGAAGPPASASRSPAALPATPPSPLPPPPTWPEPGSPGCSGDRGL